MSGSGSHVKCSRVCEDLCALQRHQACQLGETHIITDGYTQLTKSRVNDGDLVARGECVALSKLLTARNIDVKQVHLAMPANLATQRIEDKAGVVNPAGFIDLGHGSAHQGDVLLTSDGLQKLPDGSTLWFSIFWE